MDNKPFATGRTADIYDWKGGQVLKLFHDWCPPAWVDQEFKINQALHQAGLSVASVEDIVQEGGRRGIIVERLSGQTILFHLKKKPWLVPVYARQIAALHVKMHNMSFDWLPDQRQGFASAVNHAANLPVGLPEQYKQAALDRLEKLPDGNTLCHGDFHLENVVLTRRGLVVLDWMTACRGDPAGDVARSYLIMSIGEPPPETKVHWLINLLRKTFYNTYLNHYLKLSGIHLKKVQAWMLPVAAARWAENISGESPYLINIMRNTIK